MPLLLPHRSQPAWPSQARATLGSAHRPAQQEPSQSSGARGAVESPPPPPSRPISGRRGGSASRAAPARRNPARRRAHRDLPGCSSRVPGAGQTPRTLTGDRCMEFSSSSEMTSVREGTLLLTLRSSLSFSRKIANRGWMLPTCGKAQLSGSLCDGDTLGLGRGRGGGCH